MAFSIVLDRLQFFPEWQMGCYTALGRHLDDLCISSFGLLECAGQWKGRLKETAWGVGYQASG